MADIPKEVREQVLSEYARDMRTENRSHRTMNLLLVIVVGLLIVGLVLVSLYCMRCMSRLADQANERIAEIMDNLEVYSEVEIETKSNFYGSGNVNIAR